MHFNQTTGFSLLVFLVTVINTSANSGRVVSQKPQALNAISSVPYDSSEMLSTKPYKPPIVLNTATTKPWELKASFVEGYSPMTPAQRCGTFLLGVGESLCALDMVPRSILMGLKFGFGVPQFLSLAFAVRLGYGGYCNTYNVFHSSDPNNIFKIKSKMRYVLGFAELITAAFLGVSMYIEPTGLFSVYYGHLCVGFAAFGIYDVLRARDDMRNSLTIGRF